MLQHWMVAESNIGHEDKDRVDSMHFARRGAPTFSCNTLLPFCLLPEAMILGQHPYFHINFAFCWLPHGCPGNCQSNAWLHRCKVFWGAASLLFDKLRCNQRQMHRCCHNHCTFKTDFDLKLHQHPNPQCTNFTFLWISANNKCTLLILLLNLLMLYFGKYRICTFATIPIVNYQ